MNLKNIHLIVQDPRITNEINSLNKVFIIAISILLLTPVIILILSDIEMISNHRKFSIIAIQNLIDRVKEIVGQMIDDIKKETKKNRIDISTCDSSDIYRILERSIVMESVLDELDQMVISNYETIREIGVSIIEFITNEIKKFKTKEEISQAFINGKDFYFSSDTWQVIDENIASIIRLKVR